MPRRKAIGLFVAATLCLLAVSPSNAGAAVTLGPSDVSAPDGFTGCGSSPCTFANTSGPGVTVAAPFDGVLVRWRIHTSGATAEWQLRVIRQVVPGAWTATGSSAIETVFPGAAREFAARVPIAAGSLIAVNGPPSATAPLAFRSGGGTNNRWNPPLADGEDPPRSPVGAGGGFNGLFNADLEPDADGDGFGDETQDCDPADSSRATDCAPPDIQITSGPKAKTRKKRATFTFSGTDARAVAGFQCSLDGAAFASCSSPHTVKVKKGRHTLAVRAADEAGNIDATPATYAWKVKKKKKKK